MMSDKYSIEEIEAALARTYVSKVDQQELITALQGPKHTFREDQVIKHGLQNTYYSIYAGGALATNPRHLTQTEAGPWGEAVEVAIEALENLANQKFNTDENCYRLEIEFWEYAKKQVAKIKEILPERIRGNDE